MLQFIERFPNFTSLIIGIISAGVTVLVYKDVRNIVVYIFKCFSGIGLRIIDCLRNAFRRKKTRSEILKEEILKIAFQNIDALSIREKLLLERFIKEKTIEIYDTSIIGTPEFISLFSIGLIKSCQKINGNKSIEGICITPEIREILRAYFKEKEN